MTRAAEAIARVRRRLVGASPTAALDSELLVARVLGIGRAALAADPDHALADGQMAELASLAQRRLAGEPVAYLTGHREFWSLELEVTPDVLVPRPETELLVERALEGVVGVENPAVLDLGTGSGAVAIAIASERPDAAVTATDLSPAALAVARRNADRHGIRNLRFFEGSWFEPLANARFEAIVSNPPYVAKGDPALAALASEPRLALVAGESGLEAIASIVAGAAAHLAPGGRLLLEHGATQGAAARELFRSVGFEGVATCCDLGGQERVTEGARAR